MTLSLIASNGMMPEFPVQASVNYSRRRGLHHMRGRTDGKHRGSYNAKGNRSFPAGYYKQELTQAKHMTRRQLCIHAMGGKVRLGYFMPNWKNTQPTGKGEA